MTTTVEPTFEWSQEKMLEVVLNEPDDFLKVRETLTRIGVASRKEKNSISLAIFCISKEDILSFTLRNCLLLMVSTQTLLLMMCSAVIVLLAFFLTGI